MRSILAVLAGSLLLSGCGPMLSVNRLYTERTLVRDLPLEGKWTDEEGKDIVTIQVDKDGYVASLVSEGKVQRFTVHTVALGGRRFLDITPRDEPELTIAGHFFMKAWVEGGSLCAAALEEEWLRAQPGFPRHVQADGSSQVLLIASAEELQAWLARYADEPRAVGDQSCLQRLQ